MQIRNEVLFSNFSVLIDFLMEGLTFDVENVLNGVQVSIILILFDSLLMKKFAKNDFK